MAAGFDYHFIKPADPAAVQGAIQRGRTGALAAGGDAAPVRPSALAHHFTELGRVEGLFQGRHRAQLAGDPEIVGAADGGETRHDDDLDVG